MPEFVSVNGIAVAAIGAFAEGFGEEPGFAQVKIGDGGARTDDYAVFEGEMMHDGAPRGAIADEVDAMPANESKFADETLQHGEALPTCSIV